MQAATASDKAVIAAHWQTSWQMMAGCTAEEACISSNHLNWAESEQKWNWEREVAEREREIAKGKCTQQAAEKRWWFRTNRMSVQERGGRDWGNNGDVREENKGHQSRTEENPSSPYDLEPQAVRTITSGCWRGNLLPNAHIHQARALRSCVFTATALL